MTELPELPPLCLSCSSRTADHQLWCPMMKALRDERTAVALERIAAALERIVDVE